MKKLIGVILIVVAGGCAWLPKVENPVEKDIIVHPTEEQTGGATEGGKTQDARYVPWWAEKN